mgnify:CR=1 FL=1
MKNEISFLLKNPHSTKPLTSDCALCRRAGAESYELQVVSHKRVCTSHGEKWLEESKSINKKLWGQFEFLVNRRVR